MDFVEQELDEVASIGLERFKVAKQLEAEVATLEAIDQQIDQKLYYTKTRFEELTEKMNSIV